MQDNDVNWRVIRLSVVLTLCILIVGWSAYWKLELSATNHRTQIQDQSTGSQDAQDAAFENWLSDIAHIQTQIADPSVPSGMKDALKGAAEADQTQACLIGKHLSSVPGVTPPSDLTWVARNCTTP
jgi:hypothetical protein